MSWNGIVWGRGAGEAPRGKGPAGAAAPSRIPSLGLDSMALPCGQVIWDPAMAHSPHPARLEPGFSRNSCPSACNRKQGMNSPCLASLACAAFAFAIELNPARQFPHIHTPNSFLIPQGRELWLEEATPSTRHPCQLAGRAGRAAILAPPGCRMCHPLPGSGGVRSDPSRDIMEYPGLSASGRASAMQLAWPPPSPSHSSPSASPTPRGWGPTRMGTKPCFSLSLRTSGSCQDTTLVRCLKSHSQTQRIFVAGSLAPSLW